VKITVLGAGAVGGMIAARLAAAGETVSLIARGATLEAILRDGLVLEDTDGRYAGPLTATDAPENLPDQDVLVIALKAHQIPGALPTIGPLLTGRTLVVPAINGLPWWYFEGQAGPLGGTRLESLDPDGALSETFAPERLAGCVVYVASESKAPGRILSSGNRRLILGAVTDEAPALLAPFADSLTQAGFDAPTTADIRAEVWRKLWGNLWANPMSVLTGATMGEMAAEPSVRETACKMMREAQAIAASLGIALDGDIAERVDRPGAALAAFRTSMLQDYDRGRPIELEAILGSVRELSIRLGVPAPTIDTVYGLTKLRAETAGLN
jgi:2-dehydropantoate 2-reductase